MIYIVLAGAFMLISGFVLANYEVRKMKAARIQHLRQRARRGVRANQ